MRSILPQQVPLTPGFSSVSHGADLRAIDGILDGHPQAASLVHRDLVGDDASASERGRPGMSAEQVLRCLVVKILLDLTYDELAYELDDSRSVRSFCRFGFADALPKRSALQRNIKRVRPETFEAINRIVLDAARSAGIEDGSKVRADCTVVASNIHHPTDSSLLADGVRKLGGLLRAARKMVGLSATSDRTVSAKRRALEIANARNDDDRRAPYVDLLRTARLSVADGIEAAAALHKGPIRADGPLGPIQAEAIATETEHYAALLRRVIDQTERRVLRGEAVPAAEKIVSLFEVHTDIIVKDRRETQFGHKVLLTQGRSKLILDLVVLRGNPADATLVDDVLARHVAAFGGPPRQVSCDGGFASKDNLKTLKARGVHDAVFHKKRGLTEDAMASSHRVFLKLVRFRAGIEAAISRLKRCFGFRRCLWRGFQSFVAFAWASVLTCNLVTLGRLRPA